jgi:hypothetical protein
LPAAKPANRLMQALGLLMGASLFYGVHANGSGIQ